MLHTGNIWNPHTQAWKFRGIYLVYPRVMTMRNSSRAWPSSGRVPGRAGQRNLILCDLLGCRGRRLRGIYTRSCKKGVINVSHLMSDAPPDQPHSPPEQLSSSSMLADGHAVSSNVLVNEGLTTPSHLSFSGATPSRIGLQQVGTMALLIHMSCQCNA